MPYDGIVLSGAVWEMGGLLSGGRIERVFQTGRYEIALQCHAGSEKYRLLISADPENPRIHLTKSKKENPLMAPPFAMMLRKHIQSGRIVSICQEGYDRIVTITIEGHNEMGDVVNKKLITEIMGKYSNIILTSENGTIYDSIKRVDEDMSSVREVMPGRLYILPPAQDKITPEAFTALPEDELGAAKLILNHISGFSPMLCSAVCRVAGIDSKTKTDGQMRSKLNEILREVCKQIACKAYTPAILDGGRDYHCVQAALDTTDKVRKYSTVNLMLDDFYTKKDHEDRLKQKRGAVMKYINSAEDKCRRKMQIHEDTIRTVGEYEQLRKFGELITANLYKYPEFAESVVAEDYYEEGMPQVIIPVDKNKSVSQNAQMYFKKYRKNKTAYENAVKYREECQTEIEYLSSAAVMLQNDTELNEIDEIRQELIQQGYIKADKPAKGTQRKHQEPAALSNPMEFYTKDGFTIYIGKNNLQNERLTLRSARPDDVWFHLKNAPGSHVVLKASEHGGAVTAHAVECAAALAAWYSSAKNTSKTDVDYTRIKHVRKTPGGRPGMVIYTNYKTITIRPSASPETEAQQ